MRLPTSTHFGVTAVIALFWQVSLGLCLVSAIYDDGNQILNRDLDPAIFHRLGQYAPRYSVRSSPTHPPKGCKIQVVNSLERHGARLMTSGAFSRTDATLKKIQSAIARSASPDLPPELAFLKEVALLSETTSLVPYGALQAFYSGQSTAAVYRSIANPPPFVRASGDEAIDDDRVILTAKYWRLGFTGRHFPSGKLSTQADVREAARTLPEPDVVFSEMAGKNNTLDVSTCTAESNIPSSLGEDGAQLAYANSTVMPTVGKRLQDRFDASGVRDLSLTGTDLINLASTCSFETLGRAEVKNGKLVRVKQSPFCAIFNASEWAILGYVYDVGKYTGAGYGNPYFKALGQGFVRELVARFTAEPPPLAMPTSLNATIDGDADQFPLPQTGKGPTVYFDGSHDNNIGPIVAAMNLFNGPQLGTERGAQRRAHAWVFSTIAPLQGKVVFEKLQCIAREDLHTAAAAASSPSSDLREAAFLAGARRAVTAQQDVTEYVRVRANNAVLDAREWCASGDAGDGLCRMDQFLKQTAFALEATEWNKCFA